MPYDAAKDIEIDKKEVEVGGQRFLVALKSYDGGEPKVAISLANGRFPVKRMTPEQMVAIADAIREWVGRPK